MSTNCVCPEFTSIHLVTENPKLLLWPATHYDAIDPRRKRPDKKASHCARQAQLNRPANNSPKPNNTGDDQMHRLSRNIYKNPGYHPQKSRDRDYQKQFAQTAGQRRADHPFETPPDDRDDNG